MFSRIGDRRSACARAVACPNAFVSVAASALRITAPDSRGRRRASAASSATEMDKVDLPIFWLGVLPSRGTTKVRAVQLSQYFFRAAVKLLKFATGQEVGELSRTSQCM